MSLFRLLALVFLAFAFGVLVWTFVWVAKLLARREAERTVGEAGETEAAPTEPGETEPEVVPLAEDAEEEEEEEDPEEAEIESRKVGAGVNATLGLVLSILACLGFWLSPFALVLSAGGVYFSGNALYLGLRLFRVFIGRAALGLALGVASVVLFFAHRLGQFEGVLSP